VAVDLSALALAGAAHGRLTTIAIVSSERPDRVVVVAGEALFDLVLDDDGELRAHAGGGPFTAARTLGRLGRPVAYLGRLSRDRFGTTLERLLVDDGVGLETAVRTDDPTTLALAEIDADGSARYRFYAEGTSVPGLTPPDALRILPPRVAMLHVGTLRLTLEPVATALEAVVETVADDTLVAVDPNIRPWVIADPAAYRARLERILARSHVVKVSVEDLEWLAPEEEPARAARDLLAQGPAVALLTRGGEGALVVTRGGEIAIAVPPVEVVDTIGAGDAFGGGFLAWWHAHGLGADALGDDDAVVAATRFAVLVAARTCERPGASPPYASEVEEALSA
jgi:fructokinase